LSNTQFLPRDAMLVWYMLRPSVCLSFYPSQAGVLWKRLNGSSWFYAHSLSSAYATLCFMGIHVSSKISVLSSGTLSNTLNLADFPAWHVDHRKCWQLSSTDDHQQFITLIIHLRAQHDEHSAVHLRQLRLTYHLTGPLPCSHSGLHWDLHDRTLMDR